MLASVIVRQLISTDASLQGWGVAHSWCHRAWVTSIVGPTLKCARTESSPACFCSHFSLLTNLSTNQPVEFTLNNQQVELFNTNKKSGHNTI